MYKIDRRGGGRGSKNRSLGKYQSTVVKRTLSSLHEESFTDPLITLKKFKKTKKIYFNLSFAASVFSFLRSFFHCIFSPTSYIIKIV